MIHPSILHGIGGVCRLPCTCCNTREVIVRTNLVGPLNWHPFITVPDPVTTGGACLSSIKTPHTAVAITAPQINRPMLLTCKQRAVQVHKMPFSLHAMVLFCYCRRWRGRIYGRLTTTTTMAITSPIAIFPLTLLQPWPLNPVCDLAARATKFERPACNILPTILIRRFDPFLDHQINTTIHPHKHPLHDTQHMCTRWQRRDAYAKKQHSCPMSPVNRVLSC